MIAVTMTPAVLVLPLAFLVRAVIALAIELRLTMAFDALFAFYARFALAFELPLAFYPRFAFTLDLTLAVHSARRVPRAVVAVRADGLHTTVPVGALLALATVVDHSAIVAHSAVVDHLSVRGVNAALVVVNPIAKNSLLPRSSPGGRLAHRVAVRRVR
ncbi:MAG TPA: hypothetical protein VN651_01200 [Gemmatimonadaceae bacterium]|nr:hypothetical protein [Gemmatimonadaceae bacterium]